MASMIQSDFGRVEVNAIKVDTQKGQHLVFDLYKPISATEESKAPFIVVVPGFQRSKEALSNIAIELSRRGMVIALIDPYAQGLSSSSRSKRSATTEGYGMFYLVEQAHSGNFLNYIDVNKIASTGHSMGGNAAIRGANYFGKQAIKKNEPSKLHSVFVSGYVLTLQDKVLKDIRSNVGVSYALYDEGAFRNELSGWDASNMKIAPESLRVINWGINNGDKDLKEVELGNYYGSLNDSSLRVIFNEELIHPFQPYNNIATANQIEYFEKVFDLKSSISSSNQIWQWKELMTLISMITAMIMLLPLSRFFLSLNLFRSLVKEIPEAQPRQTHNSKIVFWTIFFLGAFIACFSYIPMVDAAKSIFQAAASREMTWFFPQRMNNSVMLWASFNGIVGLILFTLSYQLFGKKHGVVSSSWGLAADFKYIVKTLILAILVFATYYSFLFLIYSVLHVDYRFWFMGVRIFQPEMLLVLAMYAPLFFVFFFSNSLRVNGSMRIEGQPEWKSMLIAGIANSLGLFLIILIQYVTFARTGTVFWTTNWLSVNLLFAIVPMMFVLPYFNRYFFYMTGRVYLGPMVTTLVFIMILSTNTVVYLPI
ncbi:alpha/beta hydrolase [Gammaproteobacteria bacterium]|nr:alpha/beta hydrolase [Gammaproteobacteria bacterium]